MIQCSNCLFYPETFSSSLRCTQDTITYNYNEDFSYSTINRIERDIELYNVTEDINGHYQLSLMYGLDKSNSCKKGYFFSDSNCVPCTKGCQTC